MAGVAGKITVMAGAFASLIFVLLTNAALAQDTEAFRHARERMVTTQIARAIFGRSPVQDETVLRAMRTVPRHEFVPARLRRDAYEDTPLPIGQGQTISQPYIVATMTEALRLKPGHTVLEIGTGSGYQAAVLAEIAREGYTIEIVEPLGLRAARVLKKLGYENIHARIGDGYAGWPEHAPFDAIIVTAAPDHVPGLLVEQLKPGGRMAVPVGPRHGLQRLMLIEKTAEGRIKERVIERVRFVPLTGELGDETPK